MIRAQSVSESDGIVIPAGCLGRADGLNPDPFDLIFREYIGVQLDVDAVGVKKVG